VQSSTVLQSAITTCFECMNEPSPGVKDMVTKDNEGGWGEEEVGDR
jgi:hypothetical protein